MTTIASGEHGQEMLQLLRKHPAGTIPVIVERMKAKDAEWRRVRDELSKGWNEVLQKNYYKALDYRGNSFRQVFARFRDLQQFVSRRNHAHV